MREGDTVNVFDRAVAAVAPVHAAKRAAARAALKIIDSGYGNYGANLTKKSMRGWEFYGGSAKEDIEDNIDILRQRSRDAYMGIPTASAALKTINNAEAERCLIRGGYWGNGGIAGVFVSNLYDPRSGAGGDIGGRSAFYE